MTVLSRCPACGFSLDRSLDLTEVYTAGWMIRNLMDQSLSNGPPSWWCSLTAADNRFLTKAAEGSSPQAAISAALAAEPRTHNWRDTTDEATYSDPERKPLATLLWATRTPINRRF